MVGGDVGGDGRDNKGKGEKVSAGNGGENIGEDARMAARYGEEIGDMIREDGRGGDITAGGVVGEVVITGGDDKDVREDKGKDGIGAEMLDSEFAE